MSARGFNTTVCQQHEGVRLERKIREGFCGGSSFYRPVPVMAKHGEKLCAACARKMVSADGDAKQGALRRRE